MHFLPFPTDERSGIDPKVEMGVLTKSGTLKNAHHWGLSEMGIFRQRSMLVLFVQEPSQGPETCHDGIPFGRLSRTQYLEQRVGSKDWVSLLHKFSNFA